MEKHRCFWAENTETIYVRYHDEEWGKPVYDDRRLFEMLVLESFQAGLSWLTILKKREHFRRAFDNFEIAKVAAYDEEKIDQLLADRGIVRNRLKIRAAIHNAKIFQLIQQEFGSFAAYIWSFTDGKVIYLKDGQLPASTPLSDAISKDLKKRGMSFVGTTIIYAYLQSIGVVNDHVKGCYLHVDHV